VGGGLRKEEHLGEGGGDRPNAGARDVLGADLNRLTNVFAPGGGEAALPRLHPGGAVGEPWPRPWSPSTSTAPTSPRRATPSLPTSGASPAALDRARTAPPTSTRNCSSSWAIRPHRPTGGGSRDRVAHALPAAERPGDGERRGRHRLLPLPADGGPVRGGRRPGTVRHRARCRRSTAASGSRQARWPETMLALSTHDTKRSEDVRARLAVLSEIPDRSGRRPSGAGARWFRAPIRPGRRATEYLVYQTLVGAFPIGADRLLPYLEKATKEAKLHTSWTDPDPDYDAAVADFAAEPSSPTPDFMADLEGIPRSDRWSRPGRINSLAQKTIQLTAPGVPDLYQGTELWDLSLVDPDNRRPVDYGRSATAEALEDADPATVLPGWMRACPSCGSERPCWAAPAPDRGVRSSGRLRSARGDGGGRRPRRGLRPGRGGRDRGAAASRPTRETGRMGGDPGRDPARRVGEHLHPDHPVRGGPSRWAELADFPVAVLERR
jgi:hypothetical protein